ncbi:unnamed protein product [Cuscuta europaea]|uniref:CDP-diacylglycerol--glycerol-3-phosphate 1-phosphatidyltransferase n=1 Tax=Cuscuta europaea TaxID=41803 RepID=A0A9P0YUE0_CUSEU|nr:unnamed protein product [Cuscuta europaea]
MPGGSLKLNAVAASIYCSRNPCNRLRHLTPAAINLRLPVVPTRAWWRRLTIPHRTNDRFLHGQFYRVEKHSSHIAVRSISAAHMGSDPDNKGDEWLDASSPPPTNQRCQKPSTRPPPAAKLLTLPTILTIGRVAAVPLLVSTFYVDSWWGPATTTAIFIAAAITDWLDGYIARKLNLGTAFGAFLDPVADKLMVAATLVLLCTRPLEASIFGQFPWLLAVPSIAIIGREITMSAVREWAASQGSKLSEAVAVNSLGKWKTATQMTALTILLAARDSSLVEAGTLTSSGVILLYISAWLAVWSLVVYMKKIWKVLLL